MLVLLYNVNPLPRLQIRIRNKMMKSENNLRCVDSETEQVEHTFHFLALLQRPIGIFLVAEYDVVENGLGHSQGHQHLCVHVRALPQRHQRSLQLLQFCTEAKGNISMIYLQKEESKQIYYVQVCPRFTVQTSFFKGRLLPVMHTVQYRYS
jgi:hypothetical protein